MIGTSLTNGCCDPRHDANDSRNQAGHTRHWYGWWISEELNNNLSITSDLETNYSNHSYDTYNLATGHNQDNPGALGGPHEGFNSNKGMCLDCVPWTINDTWGRAKWRIRTTTWSDVKYLIVEGGHHDDSDQSPGGKDEQAEDIWEIYNQSKYYGYTLVLLAFAPCGSASGYSKTTCEGTNKWRYNFSLNHTDMIYVDIFHSNLTIFDGAGNWEANETLFGEGDGSEVHPNELGYRLIGKMIAEAIKDDLTPSFNRINDVASKTGLTLTSARRFNWTKVKYAEKYHLQIANDSAFTDIFYNTSNINSTNYASEYYYEDETTVYFNISNIYNEGATPGNTHYYRVRASIGD